MLGLDISLDLILLSKNSWSGGKAPPKGKCLGTSRDGSFAASSHLSLGKLLLVIYHWCFSVRLTSCMGMLALAEHTIVDWFQYMRDDCSWKRMSEPISLGGPGQIVEIDESLVIKRKYSRGACREQHQRWVCITNSIS